MFRMIPLGYLVIEIRIGSLFSGNRECQAGWGCVMYLCNISWGPGRIGACGVEGRSARKMRRKLGWALATNKAHWQTAERSKSLPVEESRSYVGLDPLDVSVPGDITTTRKGSTVKLNAKAQLSAGAGRNSYKNAVSLTARR